MSLKLIISIFVLSLLLSCSAKPPDLDSPCAQFGRFCPQYPINDIPMQEEK